MTTKTLIHIKVYLNGSIKKKEHSLVFDQCKKLCLDNSAENGGTLYAKNHIKNADYLLVGFEEARVVGYLCLRHMKDGLCITQVAVDKNYQGQGIGSRLLEYTHKHLVIDSSIYCNVRKDNTLAHKLFKRSGFDVCSVKYTLQCK